MQTFLNEMGGEIKSLKMAIPLAMTEHMVSTKDLLPENTAVYLTYDQATDKYIDVLDSKGNKIGTVSKTHCKNACLVKVLETNEYSFYGKIIASNGSNGQGTSKRSKKKQKTSSVRHLYIAAFNVWNTKRVISYQEFCEIFKNEKGIENFVCMSKV